jgi:hypothetical protein
MDALLSELLELLPVTCLIVTTIHSTELDARVLVKNVQTVVYKIDNLLTINNSIKEVDVRCTALYSRDNNLRLSSKNSCLKVELLIV